MRSNRLGIIFLGTGLLMLVAISMLFLLPPVPVNAQCGSQASSCKSCHETQAQDPVNNDGTTWHSQHSFGDFCYLCHAGNNQATDKAAAHTGMVAPLADINASCKSCHTDKTTALAQTYADTLGVSLGSGSSVATQPAAATPESTVAAPAATQEPVVLAANLVDYSQRYDAVVLGKKPANLGNIILGVIVAAMLLGGGFFVLQREGFIKLSFEDTKKILIQKKYPTDVVEMLPGIVKLKPESRKALQNILARPKIASDLFTSIDRLTQEDAVEETDVSEPSGGEVSDPEE